MSENRTSNILATVFLGLITSILMLGSPPAVYWCYGINSRLIRLETVIQSYLEMHELVHDLELRVHDLEAEK